MPFSESNAFPVSKIKKRQKNLSVFQQNLLKKLQLNDQVVFAQADKNLGPVAIELPRYITDGLKHLNDATTYVFLSEAQALTEITELKTEIYSWTVKWRQLLDDDAVFYIRDKLEEAENDPFGYFYLLYKIHKPVLSTRPVCSDCASLPHALGQWVDEMLQPIAKAQQTYFKDSFTLKRLFNELKIPRNASLFTYDAVSMYTNIDTDDCIKNLSEFLQNPNTQRQFPHYPAQALVEALVLVMRNNRMRFGDTVVKQIRGIAMGMSPAPPIANIFVALHEESEVLPFLDTCVFFLRRFIDDGFGIWLHNPNFQVDKKIGRVLKQL